MSKKLIEQVRPQRVYYKGEPVIINRLSYLDKSATEQKSVKADKINAKRAKDEYEKQYGNKDIQK